ncbi:SRPBCC family protein [Streptomyces sp. NPDC058052]|uniref:SRPBCC family protein n=1 Tax=Streptomyces sp. NPDC058052 TaxID=3346316 RepID=UPI0036E8C53A
MQTRTLERSLVIPAAPDTVWALVGGFATLADWHPHVPPATLEDGADPEVPGAVRVFTRDGAVVARELLLDRDPAARRYRYTLLDPLALPVEEYVATLAVAPHPEGAELRWSAVYRAPDALVPRVEAGFGDGVYATGLDAVRERLTSTR